MIYLKTSDLIHGNACSFGQNADEFDVIYYDPMYPPSKKCAWLRTTRVLN